MAHATPVCRWVDERGQSQISDIVPEKFRQSATCSDSRQYELSPQQQSEADQRAADQQESARQRMADELAKEKDAPPATVAAAAAPRAKRPLELITESTDCATRWRIYDESVTCFGPFRTTQGAIKPEGFAQCRDIANPEVRCGLRRD
jgi:hypothetical protein